MAENNDNNKDSQKGQVTPKKYFKKDLFLYFQGGDGISSLSSRGSSGIAKSDSFEMNGMGSRKNFGLNGNGNTAKASLENP